MPEMTFDAIRAAVQAQIDTRAQAQPDGEPMPWVRDLYPDRAIVDWDGKLYEVPYTCDGTEVLTGEWKEVVQEYVQAKVPTGRKSLMFLGEISRTGDLYRVEALRTGAWDYPGIDGGGFEVTEATLQELQQNFVAGVKGFEVCLNREHDDERPCGWVKKLELSPDKQHLYALFEITDDETKKLVDEGTLKFCSSELDFAWIDPEACRTYGDCKPKSVFEGLALTNSPYIKRMEPVQRVVSLSALRKDPGACPGSACGAHPHNPKKEANQPMTPLEEAQKQIESLKAQLEEAKASGGSAIKLSDLQLKLDEAKAEAEKTKAELAEVSKRERETRSQLAIDRVRNRLRELIRKGKLTRPVYDAAFRLCELAIKGGAETIQLTQKVSVRKIRLIEGENDTATEELDKLDVVEEVLDMLQALPDAIAVDPPQDLVLDESAPNEEDDDDEELDKAARALMKDDSKLTYRQALVLADRNKRGGKR